MCRSIKVLWRPDAQATGDEVEAVALQFVRKVSGYRKPSKANASAFERAVKDIAKVSQLLLKALERGAKVA